jgi:hypothetical protein
MRRIAMARMMHLPIPIYGSLYAKVIRGDGRVLDLGLISTRVVTDPAFSSRRCSAESDRAENLKFHAYGVGARPRLHRKQHSSPS